MRNCFACALILVLGFYTLSADKALALDLFKRKTAIVIEIEKSIADYQAVPSNGQCGPQDFLPIAEKYIPRNLKKREVVEYLKKNKFKIDIGPVLENKQQSLVGWRWYQKTFWWDHNYSIVFYFDENGNIVKMYTGMSCGLR